MRCFESNSIVEISETKGEVRLNYRGCLISRYIDGWMMDGMMYGWMERWMSGTMDGIMDG